MGKYDPERRRQSVAARERRKATIAGMWDKVEEDGSLTVITLRVDGQLSKFTNYDAVDIDLWHNEVIGQSVSMLTMLRLAPQRGYRRVHPYAYHGVTSRARWEDQPEGLPGAPSAPTPYTPRTQAEIAQYVDAAIARNEAYCQERYGCSIDELK